MSKKRKSAARKEPVIQHALSDGMAGRLADALLPSDARYDLCDRLASRQATLLTLALTEAEQQIGAWPVMVGCAQFFQAQLGEPRQWTFGPGLHALVGLLARGEYDLATDDSLSYPLKNALEKEVAEERGAGTEGAWAKHGLLHVGSMAVSLINTDHGDMDFGELACDLSVDIVETLAAANATAKAEELVDHLKRFVLEEQAEAEVRPNVATKTPGLA